MWMRSPHQQVVKYEPLLLRLDLFPRRYLMEVTSVILTEDARMNGPMALLSIRCFSAIPETLAVDSCRLGKCAIAECSNSPRPFGLRKIADVPVRRPPPNPDMVRIEP